MKNVNNDTVTRIYVLKHPITQEIRYVGKTTYSLAIRRTQHMHTSIRDKSYRSNWIKSLPERPIIELIDTCTWKESELLEQYYIRYYWEIGTRLVNATAGGEGTKGRIVTKEVIENHKEKMLKHSKTLYQYTISGEFIKSYASPRVASRELNIPDFGLYACVSGKYNRQTHVGFRWSYKSPEEFNIEDLPVRYKGHTLEVRKIVAAKHCKKVKVTNIVTGEITITNSINEAGQITGKALTGIGEECKNKHKVRGNYKFEYFNGE